MKHFIKMLLLMIGVLTITFSCQKNDETIEEQNKYEVPSIGTARLYFNENSNLGQLGSNQYFRSTDNTLNTDWEKSKAKKYKDEPQESVDILYTPIYLPTTGLAKSFIGSIEVDGAMQSRIFVLLYTQSNNKSVFSGFMLIYNLDGTIEYSSKYSDGQLVAEGLPNLANSNLNRNANSDDCESAFDNLGCFMDWIGTDWFGLDGYIENDEIEIIALGESSAGSSFNAGDWPDQGISIPALDDEWSGSNGTLEIPWWNENKVSANPVSIIMALELEYLTTPEAEWLLNEASQEQLQAIANFLNNNRAKDSDTTPDEFTDDSIDQNQMTEISQEALELALDMINFMMDHPGSLFEQSSELNNDNISFDSFEDFEYFHSQLFNSINTTIAFEDNGTIRVDTHSMPGPTLLAFNFITIVRADVPDDNNQYECLNIISANSYIEGNETFTSWTQYSNPDPNHPNGVSVIISEQYDSLDIEIIGKFKSIVEFPDFNDLKYSAFVKIKLQYSYTSGEFEDHYSYWTYLPN